MQITSEMVRELREKTGAGMMDCKKALAETDGSMEQAIDNLRKKGLAAASKKASRIASEGAVAANVDGGAGALVEVNCETDFVARTDDFQAFVREVAALVRARAPRDVEAALALPAGAGTLADQQTGRVAKIGEKISFRRFVRLGKDLAMQVAAANPSYIARENVPADVIAREKAIYRYQALAAGKPEKILNKIAEGKLEKFYGDFCLVEQAFIKDPDRKVKSLLSALAAKAGVEVRVAGFARFQVGEGMEKRSDDLAAEVARQL